MTFDRLLNLIVSTVIRRLVNGGINFGLRRIGRRPPVPRGQGAAAQGADTRAMVKRARQAAKIARRLGR
jgi:hypothetical protein